MENISETRGRTIIFVSHNLSAVSKLCEKSFWIDKGHIKEAGISEDVISNYLSNSNNSGGMKDWSNLSNAPGDHEYLVINSIKFLNKEGKLIDTIVAEEAFFIEIQYRILKEIVNGAIGFYISRITGEVIFSAFDNDFYSPEKYRRKPGLYKSKWIIPGHLLKQGIHSISLIGHIPDVRYLVKEEHVLTFNVIQKEGDIGGYVGQLGIIKPLLEVEIQKLKT